MPKAISAFSMILVASLTAFSAFGSTIKPQNTNQPARGLVLINSLEFDYTVTDRGWFGFAGARSGRVSSQKTYVLTYSTTSAKSSDPATVDSLVRDVSQRCFDLGQMDFQEQGIAMSLKPAVKAEVIHSNFASETFMCLVDISYIYKK
jgi:hypothetical protein